MKSKRELEMRYVPLTPEEAARQEELRRRNRGIAIGIIVPVVVIAVGVGVGLAVTAPLRHWESDSGY